MPARKNSCAMCRKYRMKCDLTQPQCLMCIRFGRVCPGPPIGPVIIPMTAARTTRKRKSDEKRTTAPKYSQSDHAPQKLLFGIAPQISQGNAINEVFYGKFLAYCSQTGETEDLQVQHTWLYELPGMSASSTDSALKFALQAIASAFSGLKTKNRPLDQHAHDLYGKALSYHGHGLRAKKVVTTHMITTSVLLSLFEAMNATSASAYREHINGAAKMVAMTDLNHNILEIPYPIFFHIRTQMAFIYLTTDEEYQDTMCGEQMLPEPSSHPRLSMFQRVITHIMRLSSIRIGRKEIDLELYMDVKHNVDKMWLEYQELAEAKGERLSWTTDLGVLEFRSTFTALTIAYFASTRILFSVLAPRLAASYLDLTDYYQQILDIAGFLQKRKVGCAFMRMATPLFLVAMHAPKVAHRDAATALFEGWESLGLHGVSALALDKIYADRARPELEAIEHVTTDVDLSCRPKLDLAFEEWATT